MLPSARSLSRVIRSTRVACHAGIRLDSSALSAAIAKPTISARRSMSNAELQRNVTWDLELLKHPDDDEPKRETRHTANRSQEHALRYELPNDSQTAGSERQPQGHLSRSHRCAAGQQSGHVCACHEQHHDRECDEHRRHHRQLRSGVDPGAELGADREPVISIGVRESPLETSQR